MYVCMYNFDSETQLSFIYNDQVGTINQLSNHHELENHVHAKTSSAQFTLCGINAHKLHLPLDFWIQRLNLNYLTELSKDNIVR